jgi:hypothetical protein
MSHPRYTITSKANTRGRFFGGSGPLELSRRTRDPSAAAGDAADKWFELCDWSCGMGAAEN